MQSRPALRDSVVVPLAVALVWLAIGGPAMLDAAELSNPAWMNESAREEEPQPVSAVDAITIPCTPVATTWPVVAGEAAPKLRAPQLAVVRTDFRPKDVQLHLDGRFIGRARYFNGKKGYLFLAPGRYRLEARMGGYRSDVFEIEARPSCRFDIRHRMTRSRETKKERKGDPPGKGVPGQRVFHPLGVVDPDDHGGGSVGPDPGLRPDLDLAPSQTRARGQRSSSLVVEVQPAEAGVYLDGEFLATGEELSRMVGPVAITGGSHVVEVRAPGFISQQIEFDIGSGELKKIAVVLEKSDDH